MSEITEHSLGSEHPAPEEPVEGQPGQRQHDGQDKQHHPARPGAATFSPELQVDRPEREEVKRSGEGEPGHHQQVPPVSVAVQQRHAGGEQQVEAHRSDQQATEISKPGPRSLPPRRMAHEHRQGVKADEGHPAELDGGRVVTHQPGVDIGERVICCGSQPVGGVKQNRAQQDEGDPYPYRLLAGIQYGGGDEGERQEKDEDGAVHDPYLHRFRGKE